VLGISCYRNSPRRQWRYAALLLFAFALTLGQYRVAVAQPPGTLPPPAITNPEGLPADNAAKSVDSAVGTPKQAWGLDPKAFLMLDAAGNPVVVPGMTFEKLDRLMRLDAGLERPEKPYAIESMSIVGRVVDDYAELNITTRVVVEPTGESWIKVPLRMGNFHRTGPADVSGIESYLMDLDSQGNGHVLHLQCDTRRTVVVAMRVLVRVSPPPTAAIEFRLPETICDITLKVPNVDVSASIIGRGDELLRTVKSGQSTDVKVESGGGTFSLRFGSQAPVIDNRPVLETESRIVVDWQQADNSPLAKVDLSVRNLRGDLPKVSLLIPKSLQLLQQPEVLNGSPFEVLDSVDVESDSSDPGKASENATVRRMDIVPTVARGDSRVEVSLDGQMRSEGGRPGGMVIVSPLRMDNAIQTGEIEVRTPRDYRLRWTSHPWVHSIWEKSDSDSLTTRVYRFRFDRVPFELPIWLSARTRQLRVESDFRMTLYDSRASLRMTIRSSGSIPDSRILPIEVGPWNVKSVFIADTTTQVEADRIDDTLEIDLATMPSGGSEGERIEVVLEHPLVPGESTINLPLPRIGGSEVSIGTLPSTLTVASQNESQFIIDLPASLGIGEVIRRGVVPIGTTPLPDDFRDENRYTMPDAAQASRLVGYLVRERPSVSILADAEVSIIADRITEVVDWMTYPQGTLRGRLPITWGELSVDPESAPTAALDVDTFATDLLATDSLPLGEEEATEEVNDNSGSAAPSNLVLPSLTPWSVVVDDAPATIRLDADGRYQIYSDRLAGGPHRIRFRRTRVLPSIPTSTNSLSGVFLPRPTLPDVTLRGPMIVRLRGSSEWELSAMATDGRLQDELSLTSFVEKELPLKLKPIEKREDDIIIRRGVLRTAVGDTMHHEQFLATVEGGGVLRIGLTRDFADIQPRAKVDGAVAEVLRDTNGRCVIRIGEAGVHTVDLQVWVRRESSMIVDDVHPVLSLPIGIERLYWQLIVPQDQHLVWATPTMGRDMIWELQRWRWSRRPSLNDTELMAWAGVATDISLPPGNRYLLVGIDSGSLAATTMSRLSMWLVVAATVLFVACLLIYVPAFRHPLTAVAGAITIGGLLVLLPDAAVIAGQLMMVAVLIVAVMNGVRHLMMSRRGDRVFTPSRESTEHPTTRQLGPSYDPRGDSYLPETEPVVSSGSPVESQT
jgi:hypothetical protein